MCVKELERETEVEPEALNFLPWGHGPVLDIPRTFILFPGGEIPPQ